MRATEQRAMLHVYPAPARKALARLLRAGLDIARIPAKHAHVLLEYGLHGFLPAVLYERAVALDLHAVVFFAPATVHVLDLQRAIAAAPAIGPALLRAVHFHKRALLREGDGLVLRRLVEAGVVDADDVQFLARERAVSYASLLKLNPRLARPDMQLSEEELEDVFAAVPCEHWEVLYERLDVPLPTLLRLAARARVPPLHRALLRLGDAAACLELVRQYPHTRVIEFIAPAVKYAREFVASVDELVAAALPALFPHLNRFLFRARPRAALLRRYGIKFHAMFEFAHEPFPRVSACALSEEDAAFVERHIRVYDAKAREFAVRFRQHVQCTQSRTITMYVGDELRARAPRARSTSVEDLLRHVEDLRAMRRGSLCTRDLEHALRAHHYDFSLCRRVLTSDASTPLKKRVLALMRGWRAKGLEAAHSYAKLTQSTILLDAFTYLAVRVFHVQRALLPALEAGAADAAALLAKLPLCRCARCEAVRDLSARAAPELRSALFGGAAPERGAVTDDSLLNAVYDLGVLAAHGVVDTRFVLPRAWGPLCALLAGADAIDVRGVRDALSEAALRAANVCAGGMRSAAALAHLRHVPAYEFASYDAVLRFGEAYVRAVLYFNFLMEYLFAVSLYRLVVLSSRERFREFVGKMISCLLEGFGLRFCTMRVHDCVDGELAEYVRDNCVPYHTYHLYARVVLAILEHLNGAR
ncbi:IEV morphogenesis protein [Equine molluscum contagiosum-like virus]|nr:IEV morphogenesis protein [Equine molluscum contagiosum-like virus]